MIRWPRRAVASKPARVARTRSNEQSRKSLSTSRQLDLPLMVELVRTGGTTTDSPTISETAADVDLQIQHFCRRVGCDRTATLVWTEVMTGQTIAYCAEDGVEAFNLITRWLGEPHQPLRLEAHKFEVEQVTGRGLYDAEPGRLYRGEPGQMR